MKPREVMAEVSRLAAERDWEQDSPQEVYLLELFTAREDARHKLLSNVDALRRDLDRLELILKPASPLLNTLGELQHRPAAVEAAVGEFAAANKALRNYLAAFPAKEAGQ